MELIQPLNGIRSKYTILNLNLFLGRNRISINKDNKKNIQIFIGKLVKPTVLRIEF